MFCAFAQIDCNFVVSMIEFIYMKTELKAKERYLCDNGQI